MGNLGLYQTMTTVAKRVGGPLRLGAVAVSAGMGVGAVLGIVVEHGGKAVIKAAGQKVKGRKDEEKLEAKSLYHVHSFGDAGSGLILKPDDMFQVLEQDGDAVLIEVLGDDDNPYFVSAALLSKISDYD